MTIPSPKTLFDFVGRRVGLGELPTVTLGLPIASSLFQRIGAGEIAVPVDNEIGQIAQYVSRERYL